MNILFLTLGYPEDAKSRGIYIDLMKELKSRGNNITVVTPIERRRKKDTSISNEDGIKVLRVKTLNIQKTNLIEKGMSTLLIETNFINAIKKYLNDTKFDLVMYSTPPITFEKVINYVKKRDGALSYLLLKDIFPQNAVDIEMFKKSSIIYKYFRKKEERLYEISDKIGCMSKMNKEYVLNHNSEVNKDKVEICPNSIQPLPYKEISITDRNEIRGKYNIPEDATVVIYGGNLGKPQGIDFLIKVLEENKNNKNVYFLIVGSGTEFNKINEWFNENKPTNSSLFALLPKADYDKLVEACDVGLILLDKRFTIPNFPSRLLSYMEVGIPVLAATDKNTDIGTVIEEGNFGYWCESGDIKAFNNCLNKLMESKEARKELGLNGRSYLEEHYTVKSSADIILKNM